jgi:hypothetical protein
MTFSSWLKVEWSISKRGLLQLETVFSYQPRYLSFSRGLNDRWTSWIWKQQNKSRILSFRNILTGDGRGDKEWVSGLNLKSWDKCNLFCMCWTKSFPRAINFLCSFVLLHEYRHQQPRVRGGLALWTRWKINLGHHWWHSGARGSVVGWGTMLQTGRSRVRVPMRWLFFNWPNPSSRTMTLGSTQPLTEMSTRKIPGR